MAKGEGEGWEVAAEAGVVTVAWGWAAWGWAAWGWAAWQLVPLQGREQGGHK